LTTAWPLTGYAQKKIVLGFSQIGAESEWRTANSESVKAAAKEAGIEIEKGDIALVQFGWDRNLPGGSAGRDRDWWGRNNPGMAEDLCRFFSERGVKAVGTDTVSADLGQKDNVKVADHGHQTYFLPRDILIIEGLLDLAKAPAQFYFVALPLKIRGGSGSPLRPVAIVARG
jgi:kynurenine formamidase